MKTLVCLSFVLLGIVAQRPTGRNSRDLLQGNLPFLGTYWESYLQYQTPEVSCLDLSAVFIPPEQEDDYGYNLASIPDEVKVVYIAFGDSRSRECSYSACDAYVCGLHLYGAGGLHEDLFNQLKEDIAYLQSKGHIVLLAYGGEEYGNVAGTMRYVAEAMLDAVFDLGLDGVEIVNTDGCGPGSLDEDMLLCKSQVSDQLLLLEE